jgi:mono/diheme cytochrome c family protein
VRTPRLSAPVKEALFVLGVLTVVAIGAIVGVTVWLTNGGGGEAAVRPVSPPVTGEQPQPPPPPAASTPSPPPAQTGQTGQAGGSAAGDVAAGKMVFESAGCASCHTLADAGATGTVGPNLDEAKPPHALVIMRVTNGKAAMPPFKDTLSEKQIEDVAAYVVQATSGS